jgi:hypothetical protein
VQTLSANIQPFQKHRRDRRDIRGEEMNWFDKLLASTDWPWNVLHLLGIEVTPLNKLFYNGLFCAPKFEYKSSHWFVGIYRQHLYSSGVAQCN